MIDPDSLTKTDGDSVSAFTGMTVTKNDILNVCIWKAILEGIFKFNVHFYI